MINGTSFLFFPLILMTILFIALHFRRGEVDAETKTTILPWAAIIMPFLVLSSFCGYLYGIANNPDLEYLANVFFGITYPSFIVFSISCIRYVIEL